MEMKKFIFMTVLFMAGIGVAGWEQYEEKIELLQMQNSSNEAMIARMEDNYDTLAKDYSKLSEAFEDEYGRSFYPITVDTSVVNSSQKIHIPLSVKDVIELRKGNKVTKDILFELGGLPSTNGVSNPISVVWSVLYEGEELIVTTESVTTKTNSKVQIPLELQLKEEYQEKFYNQSVPTQLKYEVNSLSRYESQ